MSYELTRPCASTTPHRRHVIAGTADWCAGYAEHGPEYVAPVTWNAPPPIVRHATPWSTLLRERGRWTNSC